MRSGQQPGSPLPQEDIYARRAEAYIQLCDFSSATQNLRRAYFFQPENTSYLERLTLVLYLQVPGAALGPREAPTSHPGLLALPPAMGALLAPKTSSDSLGTSLFCHPTCCLSHDLSHLWSWFLAPGLGKSLQHCPIELSAIMTIYLTLSDLVAISHMVLLSP